jgi:hypothetical protein
VTSAIQYSEVLDALAWLRVPGERVRVAIEALPQSDIANTSADYAKFLVSTKGLKGIQFSHPQGERRRRSKQYPQFGICRVQVLEVTPRGFSSEEQVSSLAVARASSAWQVGCYYGMLQIQARLGEDLHKYLDATTIQ